MKVKSLVGTGFAMRHLITCSLCVISLITTVRCADADLSVGEVPDPYGLGERLALIDYLRERKIIVAENETAGSLRLKFEKIKSAVTQSRPTAKDKEGVLKKNNEGEMRLKEVDARLAREDEERQEKMEASNAAAKQVADEKKKIRPDSFARR